VPLPAIQALSNAAVRDDEAPAGLGVEATPPADGARAAALAQPWHGFPRGALAGTFLHDQLEWLAGEGYALAARPELQQQLLRRCERLGWGPRATAVRDWLAAAVATPLPPLGVALHDLVGPLPEMEFWLPNAGLAAGAVDVLCRVHLLPGVERPPLPERELHGMLMGFADLVFEHGGRYWVLDYKSNHLGPHDADYAAPALAAAVAAHRYDVQAALYLLALHRLLRSRLGAAYDPARQLGGAIFYFLRGVGSTTKGCHLVKAVPQLLAGLDALIDGVAERDR
jgi:exodeoxyribonuclease V beta subunit